MTEDRFNLSMFRAYDIRTPASRLTPELAHRLAQALAVYYRDELGVPGIVLAHDARRSGPAYLTIAAEVFQEAGLEVVYFPGATSASHFYYGAMRYPDHGAILIGASHNPADDTGEKLLAPGVRPIAQGIGPDGGLDRIKSLYGEGARPTGTRSRGAIKAVDLMADYVRYSMGRAGVTAGGLKGVPVLQDYLFGAAGKEMMLGFGQAGANLYPLHYAADGSFPLGDPNPVKASVTAEGLKALREGGFLMGMFFDGDGDRLDIYRGDGAYLSSSFVYAAIVPEIKRGFAGEGRGVFADLKSNPLAVIEMARAGVSVNVIRNGHSQIKESLVLDPSRLGAVEESAHFYEAFDLEGKGPYCTENTLYLALLVARVWSEDPGRFDRLWGIQCSSAREREWGYKFPSDRARDEALAASRELFEAQGASSQDRMANGMDLEATLMRKGLPFNVKEDTVLAADWLQVCQRISQSEDRLARWEVCAATPEIARQAKDEIARCVARFGAGEEYQG